MVINKREYADIALLIGAHMRVARNLRDHAKGNAIALAAAEARAQGIEYVARDLASYFKADNPRFDRHGFILEVLGYVPPEKKEAPETAMQEAFKKSRKT